MRLIGYLIVLLNVAPLWAATSNTSANAIAKPASAAATTVHTITWDDLLPDAERNAPPPKYRPPVKFSMFGGEDPVVSQSGSTAVNKKMDGLEVKIPGFIVPLDMDGNKLRTFFLAPYYGACIHVPPPPPNQMVYVELAKPVSSQRLYDAQWVIGKLSIQSKANRFAIATYTIKAAKLERYEIRP